ncbi:MAG: 2-hydroxyacyl-CoA dehydratase [Ruminococcus sp.]|nr:2-hydroxyacyl-CoA dehydratase [Ruminococcus sp.]
MREIMKELDALSRGRVKELIQAKKDGAKIIEYNGTYIPEEIIRAAGAQTYLALRGGEPEPTDAVLDYMLRFMNPLARSLAGFMQLGLDPIMPISDLLVTQQTDNHIGRITELLEFKGIKVNKVGIPADWKTDGADAYYERSLREMIAEVEEITGKKVDWDEAKANFEKSNQINGWLRKINDLRKKDNPPVGLDDVIHLHHYSFIVDPDIMLEKLETIYNKLADAEGIFEADAPRLLFIGRAVAIGDYTVPRIFEQSGGAIVAEYFDEGYRVLQKDVETEGDLVHNFAKNRYVDTLPLSVMQPGWKERYAYFKQMIEDYRIDGVVWYQLCFDEIYDMECTCLAKWLEESKVPMLKLESSYEYSRESTGPLTTRIESFVESVKEGK